MSSHGAQSSQACRRGILHHSLAWIALCLALAVHAVDEVVGNYSSVYGPAARAWRDHLPFLRQPDYPFEVWLTGIVMAVLILLSLAFFAFLGMRWMRVLSFPFALLMIANGAGHLAGTVARGQAIAGVYSAPLLLAGAFYLLLRTHRLEPKS